MAPIEDASHAAGPTQAHPVIRFTSDDSRTPSLANHGSRRVAALLGVIGHMGKFMVRWALGALSGVPLGFVALGQVQAVVGYLVFGALGGLTLQALRREGFFAYLAEKR